MGDVLIAGGTCKDGVIEALDVRLHNLPPRVIDRETAVRWMRDGHSLVPVRAGERLPALQLVEVGDEPRYFIRTDNAPVEQDSLPDLPPAR